MGKRLAILNFISVILALFVSYYTQAIQLNGHTIGELSNSYANLFTPAGYAFAIWGIIYLGLLAFTLNHLVLVFYKKQIPIPLLQSGYWFTIANLANATWVVVWLYEFTGLSVLVMLLILFALLKITVAVHFKIIVLPLKTKALTLWPIGIYLGWISVALIANCAAWFAKLGWQGTPLNTVQWTLLMLTIAFALNLVMLIKKNMTSFALVGVWSLFAIYIKQQTLHPTIAYTALVFTLLLLMLSVYTGFKLATKSAA